MLCKDLRDGMLLEVSDDKMCGWFNDIPGNNFQSVWPDLPPRFRVGSYPIGLLMSINGVTKLFKKGDTIMYLGKKQITSVDGKSRQIRLLYINGLTGFIEGCICELSVLLPSLLSTFFGIYDILGNGGIIPLFCCIWLFIGITGCVRLGIIC